MIEILKDITGILLAFVCRGELNCRVEEVLMMYLVRYRCVHLGCFQGLLAQEEFLLMKKSPFLTVDLALEIDFADF